MGRIIGIYGSIAGIILASSFGIEHLLGANGSVILGYLIMLAALSLVFVGVKRYRDTELGGVIRFSKALLVGFGIAAVASVFYVLGWELYLYATNYSFTESYVRETLAAARASGTSPEALAAMTSEMNAFKVQYAQLPYRLMMGFAEIAPVGLLVALVSAALLRNPKLLPARVGHAQR